MRIIGSGAAEGIPNPMCFCDICEHARQVRGREVRSRSCFRVDEQTQIDFGPDQFYQSLILGNDLRKLRQVLITHSHEDHLAFTEFGLKGMASVTHPEPLDVYLSRPAYEWLRTAGAAFHYGPQRERIVKLHPIDYGVPFVAGALRIVPLKGNHMAHGVNEHSVNYHITLPDGQTLYYALDTGYFLEETFEQLKDLPVDILLADCTFGDAPGFEQPRTDGHMGCIGVLSVTERLFKQGTLSSASRVVATHINHKHSLTYARMVDWFSSRPSPVPVVVGYDGMEIER